jgi:hypothetical protein
MSYVDVRMDGSRARIGVAAISAADGECGSPANGTGGMNAGRMQDGCRVNSGRDRVMESSQ